MASSSKYGRYLIIQLVIIFLLMALPFALLKSQSYRRHVYYLWHPLVDEKLSARQMNADVVFVGDSSLLMGLQPEVIKAQTGLSSYNLGVPGEAFCMAGEVLLNTYLANNRTPKALVLYLSPQTNCSGLATGEHAGAYDNIITLALSHETARLATLLFEHPSYIPAFAMNSWELALTNFDPSGRRYSATVASLRAGDGYLANPVNVPLSGCANSDSGIPLDVKFLHQFERDYSAFGGRLAIYLSPVPDCDVRYRRYRQEAAGVADNILERFPHELFSGDAVHLAPAGAEQNSRDVGSFLSHFIIRRAVKGQEPLARSS
jgi:hypothetical protein